MKICLLLIAAAVTLSYATNARADNKSCRGSAAGIDTIDATGPKVIGQATCKGAIRKEVEARLCPSKPGEKVSFWFRYDMKSGNGDLRCSSSGRSTAPSAPSAPETSAPATGSDNEQNGLKPGQYAGVQQCIGTAGDVEVDVTSSKTIGVATCRMAIEKELLVKGVCTGKSKGEKVHYGYKFGKSSDGSTDLRCK